MNILEMVEMARSHQANPLRFDVPIASVSAPNYYGYRPEVDLSSFFMQYPGRQEGLGELIKPHEIDWDKELVSKEKSDEKKEEVKPKENPSAPIPSGGKNITPTPSGIDPQPPAATPAPTVTPSGKPLPKLVTPGAKKKARHGLLFRFGSPDQWLPADETVPDESSMLASELRSLTQKIAKNPGAYQHIENLGDWMAQKGLAPALGTAIIAATRNQRPLPHGSHPVAQASYRHPLGSVSKMIVLSGPSGPIVHVAISHNINGRMEPFGHMNTKNLMHALRIAEESLPDSPDDHAGLVSAIRVLGNSRPAKLDKRPKGS